MINKYIRKDLKGYRPYHAEHKEYDVKIDANENPFVHSHPVIMKAKEWLSDKDNITRYPDTDSTALREKLAELYHVNKENIICGVGSDQLIEYITKVFIEPGDALLAPHPSFSMYGLSGTLNHANVNLYELNEDFSYDTAEIIRLYKEVNPKIVFICTPNNPTGSRISNEEIEYLLQEIKCPVVIDEAYSEFVNQTMIDKISQYNNLIVLRTFSKAFGSAGLRIGYGIGAKEMIDAINICKAPYNLPSFSAAFAEFIIDDIDYYKGLVKKINQNKEKLYNQLKEVAGIEKVYPSVANFILIKLKDMNIIDYLQHHKVLVRGYGIEGRLAYCARVTVGTETENKRLIELLTKY